jgi:hypothetical protein
MPFWLRLRLTKKEQNSEMLQCALNKLRCASKSSPRGRYLTSSEMLPSSRLQLTRCFSNDLTGPAMESLLCSKDETRKREPMAYRAVLATPTGNGLCILPMSYGSISYDRRWSMVPLLTSLVRQSTENLLRGPCAEEFISSYSMREFRQDLVFKSYPQCT